MTLMAVIEQNKDGCEDSIYCGILVLYDHESESESDFVNRIMSTYDPNDHTTRFFEVKQKQAKVEKVAIWRLV